MAKHKWTAWSRWGDRGGDKGKWTYTVCKVCVGTDNAAWVWDHKMKSDNWRACRHCGTEWGIGSPTVQGGQAGAKQHEEKGSAGNSILNETINKRFFTLSRKKEARRTEKEEQWKTLRVQAAELGEQGKEEEAMEVLKAIKEQKEAFEEEPEDDTEPEPLSPLEAKQLSAELSRVHNLAGHFLEKYLKLERQLKEVRAKHDEAVMAEVRLEKRQSDDYEQKKRLATKAEEMEAELHDDKLPADMLEAKAGILREIAKAEKELLGAKEKMTVFSADAAKKMRDEHKDGLPAKRHRAAAGAKKDEEAGAADKGRSRADAAEVVETVDTGEQASGSGSNGGDQAKKKQEKEDAARKEELVRAARSAGEALIAEEEENKNKNKKEAKEKADKAKEAKAKAMAKAAAKEAAARKNG